MFVERCLVKLGLLPRRPVSLLRPKSPTVADTGASGSTAAAASTAATPAPAPVVAKKDYDSDDGLEYAENPFEEGHK